MSDKPRWAAVALTLAFTLQVLPQLGIQPLAPAAAPQAQPYMPAQHFGQAGPRTWTSYAINDPVTGNPYCGCEPTVGVAWDVGDGKTAMYQAYENTLRLSWDDRVAFPNTPPMSVYDSPRLTYVGGVAIANPSDPTSAAHLPNADPFLYTDYDGDRTFAGGMWVDPNPVFPVVGCSLLSYTDDNGGNWIPMPEACNNPVTWDHPSIGSGPWALPKPPMATYDRAVYYCSQGGPFIVTALTGVPTPAVMNCAVSYDGGITFVQAGPQIMLNGCGGLHGHIRVSRIDGTVYVPNKNCGSQTAIVVSEDNGATWVTRGIPGAPTGLGLTDPSVGISEQSGWIYVGQTEEDSGNPPAYAENGGAWIALSKDKGLSWEPIGQSHLALDQSRPGQCFTNMLGGQFRRFNVGCLVNDLKRAVFADVIAGDDGRAAFSFLGSNVNFCTSNQPTVPTCVGNCASGLGNQHEWQLYVAVTYDAGRTWQVDQVTSDPVQRGYIWTLGGGPPCRNLLDFNDMAIDKDGRPIVAWTDGCLGCGSYTTSTAQQAMVSRLSFGRGLHAANDCSWICDLTNQPLGGVPDPEAGDCSPEPDPEVKWVDPYHLQVITSPQTEFHGTVDLVSSNASLTAEAWGVYAGYVDEDIPIVGTADCTTEEDVYACQWTPVPITSPAQFSPSMGSCVTNVKFPHQGVYTLLLTVTDPASGRAATDFATVYVRARDPAPPRCSGAGVTPPQLLGVLVDNDADADHATAPGAPPAPAWAGGTNEITCFGAYYNIVTDQVELHLYVRDPASPVDFANAPPGSSETYWLMFKPDFGDFTDQLQVIEVWWSNAFLSACFLNGPPETTTNLFGIDPRMRHTEQPNNVCNPTGFEGLVRPVSAAWNGNDLVVSFPVIALNPVTQDNSADSGDNLLGLHAQAWHLPGAGDWDSQVAGLSLCVAGCGDFYSDDDFSPDCKSATLRFVTPNRLGLAGSCNPATPTSLSAGGSGGTLPTPPQVVAAVQGALTASLGPLGLPPLPDAGTVIADVQDAAAGAADTAGSLLDGLGLPVGGGAAPGLPAAPAPGLPAAPAAPSPPGGGSAPGLPGTPGVPGVPAVPGLPPPGSTQSAPPCCMPPPAVPPSVEEYVIVRSGWASAYVPVSTSADSPHDVWVTPLGQGLTMDMNGQTELLVEWFKGDGVNPAQRLGTDIITVFIGIGGRTAPGEDGRLNAPPGDGRSGDDIDRDNVPDALDNCSSVHNPDQSDVNGDGMGDACQADADGDGIPNVRDTCPLEADEGQRDADGDGEGDSCDDDVDGDGVNNPVDNCVWTANKDQKVSYPNLSARGDACNPDIDGDGVENLADPCPEDPSCALPAAKAPSLLADKAGKPVAAEAPAAAPQAFSAATLPAAIGAGALLVVVVALLVARRRQA